MENNETEVCSDLVAITRKKAKRIEGEVLRHLADVTQAHVAKCMDVHASTISRMKEQLNDFAQLLAALNLQLAAADSVVVAKEDQIALKRMAYNWLKAELKEENK